MKFSHRCKKIPLYDQWSTAHVQYIFSSHNLRDEKRPDCLYLQVLMDFGFFFLDPLNSDDNSEIKRNIWRWSWVISNSFRFFSTISHRLGRLKLGNEFNCYKLLIFFTYLIKQSTTCMKLVNRICCSPSTR
jgi:hypothetical protein